MPGTDSSELLYRNRLLQMIGRVCGVDSLKRLTEEDGYVDLEHTDGECQTDTSKYVTDISNFVVFQATHYTWNNQMGLYHHLFPSAVFTTKQLHAQGCYEDFRSSSELYFLALDGDSANITLDMCLDTCENFTVAGVKVSDLICKLNQMKSNLNILFDIHRTVAL